MLSTVPHVVIVRLCGVDIAISYELEQYLKLVLVIVGRADCSHHNIFAPYY